MEWPNCGGTSVQEKYKDPLFSFSNQLTPLDTFCASCDYAVWNYPEIKFEETADLHSISLLDMILSDPLYAPNFSLLQDGFILDPADEFGVVNEVNEWCSGLEQTQISEQETPSENTTCSKKRSRVDTDSKRLSREEISQYFYMPIAEAAKAMNVGLTYLKKRCRQLGIRRWPRRKLMSLQTLINNLQEGEEGMKEAVKILEREKKLLEAKPDMELQGETKRLRQACFKSNFKKRKLQVETTQTTFCGNSIDDVDEFISFFSDP